MVKSNLWEKRQIFADLLEDNLSRAVFEARLEYDIQPSIDGMIKLYGLSGKLSNEEMKQLEGWKDTFQKLLPNKKILLYGAGACGQFIGKLILEAGGDFTGFCDRRHEEYQKGLLGKPVYSPQYLLEHKEECYVATVVNLASVRKEMLNFLKENAFPMEHVLPYFYRSGSMSGHLRNRYQYFDFPELYPKGTAFVDGGAYDGKTSLFFKRWCAGEYSKILVFEPDYSNYIKCQGNLNELARVELYKAGLGAMSGEAQFFSGGASGSRIAIDGMAWAYQADAVEEIELAALDELAKETVVGFIKLDVEGAEMDALRGARETILRDKPFLAVSVYHKPEDVLVIMDYLHELDVGYRFWLRHYDFWAWETVLYASVLGLDE